MLRMATKQFQPRKVYSPNKLSGLSNQLTVKNHESNQAQNEMLWYHAGLPGARRRGAG